MLLPELKLRRDKIRSLMAQQEIDAALIACNVNLIYTYGRVVSGYLYLPLNAPARLFIKRPNRIESEREKAIAYHDNIVPMMEEIRYHIDKLELIVDNQMWTLPKYRELLFIR